MKQNLLKRFIPLSFVACGLILVSGCAQSGSGRTAMQPIDDQTLNLRVENALQNAPTGLSNVRAMTHRAVVQLTGTVNSSVEKRRAAEIARDTDGVRRVENYIEVRNQSSGE